jgi:hypothetical protein
MLAIALMVFSLVAVPAAAQLTPPTEQGAQCADAEDNDQDGYIDCQDANCWGTPYCEYDGGQTAPTTCGDTLDNEGDGLTDCFDVRDCRIAPDCSSNTNREICNDGIDNDGDGLIDMADPECSGGATGENTPVLCNNLNDDDFDGLIDLADPECRGAGGGTGQEDATPNGCLDGLDNDGDGAFDCADTDCNFQQGWDPFQNLVTCSHPEYVNAALYCSDGGDNDYDFYLPGGGIDCADNDCKGAPNCIESGCGSGKNVCCGNGLDDDNDGVADCADPDCNGAETIPGFFCEHPTELSCADQGFDNDGDGAADCADSDCASLPICNIETSCTDGIDNDGDGDVDCADSDCATDVACYCTCGDYNGDNSIDFGDVAAILSGIVTSSSGTPLEASYAAAGDCTHGLVSAFDPLNVGDNRVDIFDAGIIGLMSAGIQVYWNSNLCSGNFAADHDGDGVNNKDEVAQGTDPYVTDSDGDGFPDDIDPRPTIFDDGNADPDQDGLTTSEEVLGPYDLTPGTYDDAISDPYNRNTDELDEGGNPSGDTDDDKEEVDGPDGIRFTVDDAFTNGVLTGTDPSNWDTDGDGIPDSLDDTPVCGNGACQQIFNENGLNCAVDCCTPNGICDPGEDPLCLDCTAVPG